MKQVTMTIPERDYASREAFKSLRANLQFCGSDIKVIAITSCVANEGKSTTVLDLAVSLAESGKRTLMIDADMRNSVLAGTSKAEAGGKIFGLAHVLSGQSGLNDVIHATNYANFYVIFAGPFPPNPSELLSGKAFKSMIAKLRESFDYILIDTPPVGLVIDAAVISEVCDGSILVIASGEISYRFALEAKEQLQRSECPILGVILNKVEVQHESYGKYGKYGRYGKYGKYGGYGHYGQYGQTPQPSQTSIASKTSKENTAKEMEEIDV